MTVVRKVWIGFGALLVLVVLGSGLNIAEFGIVDRTTRKMLDSHMVALAASKAAD